MATGIREKNPFWKGGRHISEQGYVRVLVGVGHHLADRYGYAYEHRVVAEQMLGRPLQRDEIVHHLNGNKEDNRLQNLSIARGNAEHFYQHRDQSRLRKPGEVNPPVACGCGCGSVLLRYDDAGRPRSYMPGHNRQNAPNLDAVRAAITQDALSIGELAERASLDRVAARQAAHTLCKRGEIVRVKVGVYGPLGMAVRVNEQIMCACGCRQVLMRYDRHWRERQFISGHNARISHE